MDSSMAMMGGMMTMAPGVPSLFYVQRIFWSFVGTAISVATIANILNRILYHHRIASSRDRNSPTPAKPRSFFFRAYATISAVIREFGYYSMPLSFRNIHIYLPPAGPITVIVAYVILIVGCIFYRLNPKDLLEWEDIGYRAGFIAVAQLPLIVLLSGKRNIIGLLTGMGYERLNWFHRWIARCLLLTVLIHMGFWVTEWNKYDYAIVKVKEDPLTQRGIAAGSVLAWIVLSSLAPIRGLSYEVFVVQHIISWLGFFVALYFHVPDENKMWIYIPLGFWAFDRLLRAGCMAYANLSLFHKNTAGFLGCKAVFEPLDESHTRITIPNPPVSWKAGQHMFLACHVVAPLSSHPFTIASLPEDGRLEFIVRAKKGATRRFFKYAQKFYPSLPSSNGQDKGRSVLIDGPYSTTRPLRQFDSLVFVSGSTGATFTVPLMRDVVQQWTGARNSASSARLGLSPPNGAVTRHIRFIWVVKKKSTVSWFGSQLDKVVQDVEELRDQGVDVAIEISIYITCDDGLTSEQSSIIGEKPHMPRGQIAQTSGRESPVSDEKDLATTTAEVSSQLSSSSAKEECCCTRIISNEDAITSECNCASRKQQREGSSSSSTSSSSSGKPTPIVDPRIALLSGRPHVPNIIRKTAELALGEMAVVVCGPSGLVQCTRNAAVAISDDRAVHKGSGAQGIYVHAETFGYA